MLSKIKQKLPEDHCIAYYKSVPDGHIDGSLTGFVKWFNGQQLPLQKAKSANKRAGNSTAHVHILKCASHWSIEEILGLETRLGVKEVYMFIQYLE